MKLLFFVSVTCLFTQGFAAKCMSPADARFLVPKLGVPDEWKASRKWHTGDYFPSPVLAQPGGVLLTQQLNATRMWWLKDGDSELYMILSKDQNSILCTLIGAGLQVGWSALSTEAKRSGYCHWIITVHPQNPSLFQMRNYELSEIPDIGAVYLNKTGLYFDYGSNSLNNPLNRVNESMTWWRWESDTIDGEMVEMSALPDECELGDAGLPVFMEEFDMNQALQGRSVGGGRRRKRVRFTSEDKFARCGSRWFLHDMKCYRIFRAPGLTRYRTMRICNAIGGRMVLPETPRENMFVRSLGRRFARGKRFWLRSTIPADISSPTWKDFEDDGRSLLIKPFRLRRLVPSQRCAQVMPYAGGNNWIPANCDDNTACVLCERDATPTETPGSLKCGRILEPGLNVLMATLHRGGSPGSAQRVVGGADARAGQLPWQAGLRFKELQEIDGFAISHYCGGTVIDERWVMSAAHCFAHRTASEFYVRLGDLSNDLDEGTEQDFDIEQLIIHEEYTSVPSHRNDIALIKLNASATFNKYVQPACLPTPDFRIRPDGERCQVSGWGLTDLEKGQASAATLLQYATIPTMPDKICSRRYNRRRRYFVNDLMFCAGYRGGGQDSCSGDSGGPYVCRNTDGRYSVAGIVSFGIGCAHKVYPGVYTKVQHYIPWITEKIRAHGGGVIIA